MAKVPLTASRKLTQATLEMAIIDPVVICGSFEVDGAADVVLVRGEGFTVDRTGVGVFEVEMAELYPMLTNATASVQADTAATLDDLAAQPGIYDPATGILEILTYDVVATPALTDGDGPRVNFTATFHRRDALKVTHS